MRIMGQFGWLGTATSPSSKGQLIGHFLSPALLDRQLRMMEQANVRLDLLQLAAVLAVFRAEKGSYPNKLSELIPEVFDKLPVDSFQSNPFVYRRIGSGYLLYSMGENGSDDGGSNAELGILEGQLVQEVDANNSAGLQAKIAEGTDDVSIRVPRPAFEMPKSPAVK